MSTVRTVDEVVGITSYSGGRLFVATRSGRCFTIDWLAAEWEELAPIPGTEAQRADLAARSEATDE